MFFSLLSQGQSYFPFPDSNAVWRENYIYQYVSQNQYRFGIIGDTVLNTLTYHKLYLQNNCLNDTNFTAANSTLVGAIREDNFKRVFFYNIFGGLYGEQDSIYKLYDFAVNVGDTIRFNNNGFFLQNYTVVDSIDSVYIYNQYRKQYHLRNDDWIEGIGSLRSLLSTVTPLPTCICQWENVCFEQNSITYYLNPPYLDCYIMDFGIDDATLNSKQIGFYPNPVSDYAMLDLSKLDQKIDRIEFYNVLGKRVKFIDVPDNNIVEFRQGMLLPGIYFYSLANGGKHPYVGKLIVE